MKILTFTTLYPNARNPAFGIFIKNRIAAVCQLPDVQVKVVAPIPYFPPIKFFKKWYAHSLIPKYEIIDGIEVFHPRYLVTPKIGMTLYGLWMFLGSMRCIRSLQAEFDFDLIDGHYVYPDGFAAVLLGMVFKKPVVVSARGTDINVFSKLRFVKALVRQTLKRANRIVSVSSSLGRIMAEAGADPHKIHVIPNGINPTHFHRKDRAGTRKKLGLSEMGHVLLSVGNLVEGKGFHLLIEAVKTLKEEGTLDFKVYIIGTGPEAGALLNFIYSYELDAQVRLVGHVPNDQLVDWYNAADLFFLGSSREGWPNVICEALACGTPVVATKVNGIPEILNDEKLGIMVERVPADFAVGLEEAFARSWDREYIAAKGQGRTWSTVAKEVYAVFSEVIANAQN